MNKYSLLLEESKFYHIYNQGNNREYLFYNDDNYIYFLQKLDYYLSDFIELYAFCLMPNHFHLLVKIKTLEELDENSKEQVIAFELVKSLKLNKFEDRLATKPVKFQKLNRFDKSTAYSLFISNQFRLFFMSYSKSINKQTGRRGSLFREIFKRKEINTLLYLQQTVVYIHRNPVHHGLDTNFTNYRWSSYDRVLKEKVTKLKRDEVLEWFEDKDNYRYVHCCNVEDDIE